MFQLALLTVVVVLLIYVWVRGFSKPRSRSSTTIPGLEPTDSVQGNFPDIVSSGSFHEFLSDLHQTYGDIASFWWGPQLTVSIASPQLFKEQCKLFDRPVPLFKMVEPLIGPDSVQFTNGDAGRKRHAAYLKCLNTNAVKNYYDLFNKSTKEFISKWRSLPRYEHIPLRQYMMAYSIKAGLQGLFGNFFQNDARIKQIRQAYDFVWQELEDRLRSKPREFDEAQQKEFDRNVKDLYTIVEECAEYRRRHPATAAEQLVIDAILELDSSEAVKRSDLVTNLVASFHTSGTLMVWSTYYLAKHPDVQEKLREELVTKLGTSEIDPDNVGQLTYLQQVLDESLRCSKVALFAARYQETETVLCGHKIPPGTPVVQALSVMFDDPKLYPQPEKFDPERFSPENVKNRPKFSFEPFGFAGKRKCPGYRFALLEAKILLSEVVRSFRVSLVEGQVVTPLYGLVTIPKEEVWVNVKSI